MSESPEDAHTDEAYPQPAQSPEPAQPRPTKPPSTWRSIGVGALGLVAGLLVALLLQDLIAMVFALSGGSAPVGAAVVIGSFTPIIAVTGVIVALFIDRRIRTRRREGA
ncbi:hypothetical protein [Enemella sp. A6]|uniref:hypothetical protein n=1 Tax=Enemella sp. A6 TaxID=3440152 RepID=UPI003EB721A5